MYVLGVWDGHDAGAALIDDDRVVYAANEERFTKRKLEIGFPSNSVMAAVEYAGLKPADIKHVAFSTTELAKTMERVVPSMRERYYLLRRRKVPRPRYEDFWLGMKYTLTGIGILPGCNAVSSSWIARNLRHLGFRDFKLHVVEHHLAHAATAAFTGEESQGSRLVITLDGLGDGLSGSVSTLENGRLERRMAIRARDSLGIFFEQVTHIVGMRELEDEGKVMAMADYSYPFDYESNRMKDFFRLEGTILNARYGARKQYSLLRSMAWQMPREQFSYMAQQLVESMLVKLVSNAVDRFGIGDVAFAGGVFANVKANMKVRRLENVKHWYIFPHMGDGGIAMGSALQASHELTGASHFRFNAYLGNGYTDEETENIVRADRQFTHEHEEPSEQAKHAAELLEQGNYIFWSQGRMEYGPRALGNRSIIAPAGSVSVKDKLNMYVKKREWFQPFAPSMLETDAAKVLEYDGKGADRFMTMAYMVRPEMHGATVSVVNVDHSARPQIVGGENPLYAGLLQEVKRRIGIGVVLNTSFNLHGYPIVMDPADALKVMKSTNTKYMFINGITVTNRKGV
jgi:carbamoyltransferase